MDERSSWLPPGVEGPEPEPDDRASQRRELRDRKRSERDAPGGQKPSDQKRSAGGKQREQADRKSASQGKPQPASQRKPKSSSQKPESTAAKIEAARAEVKKRPDQSREERPDQSREERPDQSRPKDRRPQPQDSDQREQRRERHEEAGVDAMGQDKHRKVVGQKFGIGKGRQFLYYGIFVVAVVLAFIGLRAATDSLDKAPSHDRDQAPWSKPGAPQGPLGGFAPHKPGQKGPAQFQ